MAFFKEVLSSNWIFCSLMAHKAQGSLPRFQSFWDFFQSSLREIILVELSFKANKKTNFAIQWEQLIEVKVNIVLWTLSSEHCFLTNLRWTMAMLEDEVNCLIAFCHTDNLVTSRSSKIEVICQVSAYRIVNSAICKLTVFIQSLYKVLCFPDQKVCCLVS